MASDTGGTADEALRQAAYWLVLLRTSENLVAPLHEFRVWYNASPENRRAYRKLKRIWRDLRELHDSGRLGEIEPLRAGDGKAPSRRRVFSRPWTLLVVGCLLCPVCLIRGDLDLKSRWAPRQNLASTLCGGSAADPSRAACKLSKGQQTSDYGQISALELVDGSLISLDGNSQVTLDLNDDHRHVRLDRGEALFSVAQNRTAPFEVQIGSTTVRAIGTIFSIERKGADSAETVVQEGRVLIFRDRQAPIAVRAGQVAEVEHGAVSLRPPARSMVDARLSWTAGLLSFDGQKLAEVAEKFNRYNRRKLLVDADIADQPVAGLFSSTNPDEFAAAFEQLNGVQYSVSRDPDTQTIRLSRRKPVGRSPGNPGDRDALEEKQ